MCPVLFIWEREEKFDFRSFKEKKTTRFRTAWEHTGHYVQPWPASYSSRQLFCSIGGFFPPFFLVSGIFNRLQHFGVTFSWGGQLKCTIISCRKWQWNEKWGGSYWIAKNVFAVQTQPAVRDVPCPSALRPGTAWHLRVESLVFARACLLSFLLFLRLITLQSVPRFAASSQYIWAKVVRGNTLITF